jgi:hypothetical protein
MSRESTLPATHGKLKLFLTCEDILKKDGTDHSERMGDTFSFLIVEILSWLSVDEKALDRFRWHTLNVAMETLPLSRALATTIPAMTLTPAALVDLARHLGHDGGLYERTLRESEVSDAEGQPGDSDSPGSGEQVPVGDGG